MQNLLKAYTQQSSRQPRNETDEAVRKYAPIVYRVVRQVAERMPASVDREYLFSAGMVGLLDALSKYDQDRGIAFEAYARIRIKGAVLDELRSLDHLTRSMRRRSRTVADSRSELEKQEGGAVSDEDVAHDLGMSIEEVQVSRSRKTPPEVLDPSTLDSMSVPGLWQQSDSAIDSMEWNEHVKRLSAALAELPERNRLVIGLYYEAELTLQEIGDVLGVTQSRISQILRKTVEILRERLLNESAQG
ncbi:MAG TPA: RNA polymerase sigma factor FliA [Myxococcales bacterium LLY-WYZ-16_1]|jgi:RNA polymerase sigma factor for flagellar operon FliA|nr:RNA polymerase sigma factor FliA [Myxococcales bacterium LLY-WYZ-16_1]